MLTMLTYWIKEFCRTWGHPNCAATWRFNRPWVKTAAMLPTASVVRLEIFRNGFSEIASEYQTCWEHVMICLICQAGFARWLCSATVSIEGSAARLQNYHATLWHHCDINAILGTLPTIFEIDQKAPACIRFPEFPGCPVGFDVNKSTIKTANHSFLRFRLPPWSQLLLPQYQKEASPPQGKNNRRSPDMSFVRAKKRLRRCLAHATGTCSELDSEIATA